MDWGNITDNTLGALFGVDALYFAIAAIGLNLQFGFTGLPNFGQAAFLACGAYGLGMSTFYFGVSMWWGLLIGLLFTVVLALLMGVPTLRLRSDYLAIATIAMAEVVRLLVRSTSLKEVLGGADGITDFSASYRDLSPFDPSTQYGIGPFQNEGLIAVLLAIGWGGLAVVVAWAVVRRWGGERSPQNRRVLVAVLAAGVAAVLLVLFSRIGYSGYTLWTLVLGWSLVALLALFVWALMRSPWGRVLRGIREDEDAVRSLGKSVFSYKLQALVMGGVFGMLAGVVRALDRGSVQPDNYGRDLTFYILTALVLGGLATIVGPIIGPMLFWAVLAFTDNFLNQAAGSDGILKLGPVTVIENVTQVGQIRLALVGLALMLLMIFRPQGLLGNREEMALDER